MCGLCGVLGAGRHWTDAAPRPGVYTRNTDEVERRRERRHRVAQLDRVLRPLGLRLEDWQGASFVLCDRSGGTEMVDDLAHLWAAAERLSGRAGDPLDVGLIETLEKQQARESPEGRRG